MSVDSLRLSDLTNGRASARARLIDGLITQGFAYVKVDAAELLEALQNGLIQAKQLEGFRFPPNDESPTVYNQVKRDTFRALFEISTRCFTALCADHPLPTEMQTALTRLRHGQPELFGGGKTPDEPFNDAHVFAQSFFNLFNYDHGLLNPHFDRSLLTVIKAIGGSHLREAQSALWIRSSQNVWTNADEAVGTDEVIIMIGEDCESLPFAQKLGLYAAEHAVRVDPVGAYISHSHFRPDPSTPSQQNRTSAAFILRHDPVKTS